MCNKPPAQLQNCLIPIAALVLGVAFGVALGVTISQHVHAPKANQESSSLNSLADIPRPDCAPRPEYDRLKEIIDLLAKGEVKSSRKEFEKQFASFPMEKIKMGGAPWYPVMDFTHLDHFAVLLRKEVGRGTTSTYATRQAEKFDDLVNGRSSFEDKEAASDAPYARVTEDVAAGVCSWYLVVAFNRENGLLQWWHVFTSYK